ncbi:MULTISPECIES: fructose bisphosphate aldolase [Anoxynatronum]|uniref:fructose-bisphosphate aldolase n=2 Tax=Anoxynatronum TaxID=210622 RepID=A0AA45WV48_9CLOT|nr:fructose bisphosphate aldolase [Anoxynatronum buryatiense]SMP51139.1 fructose-bisphosphate aldolase, class I [Anoxynatronum buryatiense]
MNMHQLKKMGNGKGFIAALDQSGGSTPKALAAYGISEDQYTGKEKMFELVHEMRSRIMTSPAFTSGHILGVILFEQTMDSLVDGMPTATYLWEKKGILSFLKVDQGLADVSEGVQLMKPMTGLDELLARAVKHHIFGTKMRSVIKSAVPEGIRKIVDQQFDYGKQILAAGLVPILEPEVDIHSTDKAESERLLKIEILNHLDQLPEDALVMLKLSIPDRDGFYQDLTTHPRVLRVVALSGGYNREEAVERLSRNPHLIASFSRALVEGLTAQQTDNAFNAMLKDAIRDIYMASIT